MKRSPDNSPWQVRWLFAVGLLGFWSVACPGQEPANQPQESARATRQQHLAKLAATAEREKQPVIPGSNGWLFLTSDVRFSSLGPFWGDSARGVSKARKPEFADPLPAILDFHRQLQSRGIELWVVPVPPKPAIEWSGLTGEEAMDRIRCDGAVGEFLAELGRHDVRVIDLEPEFDRARRERRAQTFCRTDSHWSGEGLTIAAEIIAASLREQSWFAPGGMPGVQDERPPAYRRVRESVTFRGDLTALAAGSGSEPNRPGERDSEKLELQGVVEVATGRPPVPPPQARILLLGDSHTLFLHEPALHATGAGLSDQLTWELNEPVALIGVRGSGSTSARLTLARQPEKLRGTRAVVWCFAARELTESTDGWRPLTVVKP